MIPLQMELGGKDCCLVLEDADLELAANNVIKGGYSYRFGADFLQSCKYNIVLKIPSNLGYPPLVY